ncbi:unnamed protein product [Alopecurus aequalis]
MVASVDCGFFFDDELVGERGRGKPAMDACALCDKLLVREDDIFMYRGDTPYCSDQCRHQQMRLDAACARKADRLLTPYSSGTETRRGQPQESTKVYVASLQHRV